MEEINFSFDTFMKNSAIRFLALDKYQKIKSRLYSHDISQDPEFQTMFNAFYRVRRGEEWRKVFYSFFESNKHRKDITFNEILDYMFEKTGNIEASFSSKMLSTINPNNPIWDQYVLKNLGLEVNGSNKEERMEDTKRVYRQIVDIENEYLKRPDIQKAVEEFKDYFYEYDLSDIKSLDYILWNTR